MHTIKQFCINSAAINLITILSLSTAFAQQTGQVDQSVPCINKTRIQNVDIVDNKNIVFQTGINDYYLNTLPYACNGLKLNDSFMFRTSLNELCTVDVITVLDDIGPEFQTGPSCGLGRFEPVSEEEIKTLKNNLKAKNRS